MLSAEERIEVVRSLYEGDNRVKIVGFTDLAVDLAKRERAAFIVKGVRSIRDFEYEREQAELNRNMTGIETLLLYADPSMASISSSAVRQLAYFHKALSWMVPKSKKGKTGKE